jgi:hypothetical protein
LKAPEIQRRLAPKAEGNKPSSIGLADLNARI